jgi:DNA-binding beta-propeller fold protein YncE
MATRVPSAAILASLLVLLSGCANTGRADITSVPGGRSPTASPSTTTIGMVSQVPVGNAPVFAAADHTTQTLYVTNSGDNTVSVIDMAKCNSLNASRCTGHWPVIAVGHLPLGLAVAQATDTVYVANATDGTVSVINGATCNGHDMSGCDQRPATVSVGAFDDAVAVDPVTNMVFVTNQDARPGTLSVINGDSCNGSDPAGCAHQPFMTVQVGGGPSGVDVNPLTNTVYVANTAEDHNNEPVPHGSTLSVIDGTTCKPTDTSGCAPVGTVRVGMDPANVAVDPTTNSVYVANSYDNTSSPTGTVSVVAGAHCDASDASGCASQTPPQVPVGTDPVSTAIDKMTDTVYVTNYKDKTVSVMDAVRPGQLSTMICIPST